MATTLSQESSLGTASDEGEEQLGPVLEVLTGDLAGRAYEIVGQRFTIGRASGCDLVIPRRYISRQHAQIVRQGEQFQVSGLSQKNPVHVQQRPVTSHDLQDGELFEVCGVAFRFKRWGKGTGRKTAGVAMETSGDFGGVSGDFGAVSGAVSGGGELGDSDSGLGALGKLSGDWDGDEAWGPDDPSASGSGTGLIGSAAGSGGGVVFDVGDDPFASGEHVNEKTAELGVTAQADDPDYDPFADVELTPDKPVKKTDPAREKLLKAVLPIGLLGIAVAAGIVYKVTRPKEWTPEVYEDPITVRPGEAVQFQLRWASHDPPARPSYTDPMGRPHWVLEGDPVAHVEIAVPDMEGVSTFLVHGLELGSTAFYVEFPNSRRSLEIPVEVEGNDPHEAWQQEEKKLLARKMQDWDWSDARYGGPWELTRLIHQFKRASEEFYEERKVPGKEHNLRLALDAAERAVLACEAGEKVMGELGQSQGPELTDLIKNVRTWRIQLKDELEGFIRREIAKYEHSVQYGETKEADVRHLRRVLRAICHDCDPNWIRLKMILQEYYQELHRPVEGEECPWRTAEEERAAEAEAAAERAQPGDQPPLLDEPDPDPFG